eukprot:193882-Prymnesium_polylepis.1
MAAWNNPAPATRLAERRCSGELSASVCAQYDGFHKMGLEYGPAYRLLEHAWSLGDGARKGGSGQQGAVATLRSVSRPHGVA